MSEYQYYEFLAIDRALTVEEQTDIRSLSTRARITATSFTNEYHWGDFRGDPNRLMQRFYDAHLYVANWGTRRVMFRLPSALIDLETAAKYCTDDFASAQASNDFTVLDFTSDTEDAGDDFDVDVDENGQGLLSSIIGVRAELAAGDLRPLYLAWLASCSSYDLDGDAFDADLEPPVPSGLARLTPAQAALADFLRVDEDLLAVAALNSPPIEAASSDPEALANWIQRFPDAEKTQHLLRAMRGEAAGVGAELNRQYRVASAPGTPAQPRRSVTALFEAATHRRQEHARLAAAERAAAAGDAAWSRVEALIDARKPLEYDAAVALRHAHVRKVSMIERLDKAGI